MAGWSGDMILGSRSQVRSPLRTNFFSLKKKELTSWWSVAILSTKNRRGELWGELWDSQLTPQLELVSSAFVE